MKRAVLSVAVAFAAVLAMPSMAFAADDSIQKPPPAPRDPPSPFRFGASREVPIVVLGSAMNAAWLFNQDVQCVPTCVPIRTNAVDEAFRPSHPSRTASDIADVSLAALLILPHVANMAGTWPRDRVWVEDLILTTEAALIASGVSQVVKLAASRDAPLVSDPEAPEDRKRAPDANKSFWSAHTATAVGAATAFATAYALRHPESPWRWVLLVGLESVALAVGGLVMAGGDHYATDVLAGAGAGAMVGVTIPLMHTSPALGGFR